MGKNHSFFLKKIKFPEYMKNQENFEFVECSEFA